jgi:hypothetical protein
MRRYPLFAVVLLACSTSSADVPRSDSATKTLATTASPKATDTSGGTVARDSASLPATATPDVRPAAAADLPIIRGLYVNRFAAQSSKRMKKLIAIADSTEINAFVIDVKDEFGLNIPSTEPMLVKNAGKAGVIPTREERR